MDTSSSINVSSRDVSIDEIMESEIKKRGKNVVACECNSTCSTRRCECFALDVSCTGACNCGTKKKSCNNNKEVRHFQ